MKTEVLVIGSGIAGLRAALALARAVDVLLVTKKRISESNTNYAQGGIASVLDRTDSFGDHLADTLEAGAGICRDDVVRAVVQRGPAMIDDLVAHGIDFSRERDGSYRLGREGGHSHRRIVHAGDFTGREIESGLVARVRSHPRIRLAEDHMAVDLLRAGGDRVVGARVLDRHDGRQFDVQARAVLLASGGCGKVYRYTSNPDIATGDGLAMAWRAGATLADLEFVQFHPTSLFHPRATNFLISEAVRGEGAVLRNLDGEAFMGRYHERADLAPRDVVARCIDQECKSRAETHVLLDTTIFDRDFVEERFPTISARCREVGLDMTREPLPVVPAAHYQCGGIVVDGAARSDLTGLYVIGEAACTGLHGANRLASNSLLEALVLAHAASEDLLGRWEEIGEPPRADPLEFGNGRDPMNPTALKHDWEVARKTMWDYVGIVREQERLTVARDRLATLARDAEHYAALHSMEPDLAELRNLTLLGELIIRSAGFRRESRGLHAMLEYPQRDDAFAGDTLQRIDCDEPWLLPLDPRGFGVREWAAATEAQE
ncbi:MAG TPA: L-aspartate oxidase [Candidatus Krumholzibacteria bacterium]|nr:L-aspartate oxidase [Candidatus Krumholzibacteria bacterium]